MPASDAIPVELRTAQPDDLPFLEALFRQVHSPEFASLGLPAPMLDQLLAMQFAAQGTGYRSQFPEADDKLILLHGEPAGRLLVARSSEAIQVVDIALLDGWRGRGAGTQLLKGLAEEAHAAGKPLRLTVRFDNSALRLYERLGFRRSGGDGLNLSMELSPATATPVPMQASGAETGDVEPDDPHGAVEQGFSSRYFRTLLGQPVCASSDDGRSLTLILDSIEPLPHGPAAADNFILRFSGPVEVVLPSAMNNLTLRGQAPMPIFLVPLGPEGGRMQYEAIFNRL